MSLSPHEFPMQDQHGQPAGTMWLLPAKKGTCPICATKHEAQLPHNAQSLFYQTRFHMENGRAADWRDAMAHCADDVRDAWTAELIRLGVDVEGGKVQAPRAKARK